MDRNGRTWVGMGRREWTWIGIDAPIPHVRLGGPPKGRVHAVCLGDPVLQHIQLHKVGKAWHPTVWILSSASGYYHQRQHLEIKIKMT